MGGYRRQQLLPPATAAAGGLAANLMRANPRADLGGLYDRVRTTIAQNHSTSEPSAVGHNTQILKGAMPCPGRVEGVEVLESIVAQHLMHWHTIERSWIDFFWLGAYGVIPKPQTYQFCIVMRYFEVGYLVHYQFTS